MPELPEVEIVKLGIASFFEKKTIKKIVVKNRNLRIKVPCGLIKKAENQTIINIQRRAKYLLLNLSNNYSLIIHLGMSGKIRVVSSADDLLKHDHIIIDFDDYEQRLIYNDARRFGCFTIMETNKIFQSSLFKKIGLEPLSAAFSASYLFKKLGSRSLDIKNALLDQKIVAGIGNIYASEILFSAQILPTRKAQGLSFAEIEKLVSAIKLILEQAIKAGGTTIRDYQTPTGDQGYFVNQLAVYGRNGQKCLNCDCQKLKNNVIKKIIQNQRSTFYCANCQH